MILRLAKKLLGSEEAPPRDRGRNEACWCGSGRKYKACHQASDEQKRVSARAAACRGTT